MEFHDLHFVEAPAAPGPSKSGVGCLDFVGLKVSSSNAMFLVCRGRFGIFQKCAYKIWSPNPTRSIFLGYAFVLSLLLCFYVFLASLLSAFPLFVLPAFPAFMFVCFCAFMFSVSSAFAFPAFLFFCFYAFLLNSFTFLQSCVFAALLLAFLLLCFLSLPSLCLAFFLLCSLLFVTQMRHQRDPRHPKEILIRNPTWNP